VTSIDRRTFLTSAAGAAWEWGKPAGERAAQDDSAGAASMNVKEKLTYAAWRDGAAKLKTAAAVYG